MAKRLGSLTAQVYDMVITYVILDDGRAACEHVASGESPSASMGDGTITDDRERFGRRVFTIAMCARCIARYGRRN